MRLGEPTSSEHITLSAISQPATPVTTDQLVRSLHSVQAKSPFPKLPPYYNIEDNTTSPTAEKEEEVGKKAEEEEEVKEEEDTANHIRQWTASDFETDSD